MKGLRIIPEETAVNFIGMRYVAYVISAVLILGSIFMISTKGLNFGIDFTGGTVIEIKTPVEPDLAEMRTLLNGLALGAISIQEFGAKDDLLIRLPQQVEDPIVVKEREECRAESKEWDECPPMAQELAIEDVRQAINDTFAEDGEVDYRRVEYVGPQVGEELKQQGMIAVFLSMIGILAYVWFRFEWQFGVAAIIALLHDTVAIMGLFAFAQMDFDLSTVAAILMIAGYSINDTVVVFDRIRENLRKYKKMPLTELFNMSINQMLSRTLMTSFTTLLALIALYVLGGEVIRGFVDALIIGIVVGTYSSVFVAAPVLLLTNIKRSEVQTGEAQEA
ncbi:MAG: protein translocase subunit SecF [Alphaproteobacteria bacterium]|nr:protein translocase subunit SecF [Alphaproteobacteria bacterium]